MLPSLRHAHRGLRGARKGSHQRRSERLPPSVNGRQATVVLKRAAPSQDPQGGAARFFVCLVTSSSRPLGAARRWWTSHRPRPPSLGPDVGPAPTFLQADSVEQPCSPSTADHGLRVAGLGSCGANGPVITGVWIARQEKPLNTRRKTTQLHLAFVSRDAETTKEVAFAKNHLSTDALGIPWVLISTTGGGQHGPAFEQARSSEGRRQADPGHKSGDYMGPP